jgi:hypothetical protein
MPMDSPSTTLGRYGELEGVIYLEKLVKNEPKDRTDGGYVESVHNNLPQAHTIQQSPFFHPGTNRFLCSDFELEDTRTG